MSWKDKFYWHRINPFAYYCAFVENRKIWDWQMERIKVKSPWPHDDNKEAQALCSHFWELPNDIADCSLITLREKPPSIQRLVTNFTHEATHVIQQACLQAGEKNIGNETQAYMIGNLTGLLFNDYLRWHKLPKVWKVTDWRV